MEKLSLDIKTSVINSQISYRERMCVVENIRYPEFSSDEKLYGNLIPKMNKFYKTAAEKFSAFAHSTVAKKAYPRVPKTGKLYGVVMNCSVGFYNDKVISVVVDLSGFDGEKNSAERMCQNWSVEKCDMVPASFFLKTDRKSKRLLLDYVQKIVSVNSANPSFGYYGDCEKILARKFTLDNLCFVPKGPAFFVDSGLLCDRKYGPSVFVVPKSMAKDAFRRSPFE